MECFCVSSQKFSGNIKVVKYKEILAELLSSLQDLVVNISIKLDLFPANLGFLSDEQEGIRFIRVSVKCK